MEGLSLILLGVLMFTIIISLLVLIILFARSKLVPSGNVKIVINEDPNKTVEAPIGSKLLFALADNNIYLPSACGGSGTCGECKCIITEGGGDILPTEKAKLTRGEIKQGYRLSCQVPVKNDMKIEIPPEVFEIKKWVCTVRSNRKFILKISTLTKSIEKIGKNLDCLIWSQKWMSQLFVLTPWLIIQMKKVLLC